MANVESDGVSTAGMNWRFVAIALAVFALTMLTACTWAKHLVIWVAVNRGMGTPSGEKMAMICTGFAFAAPVYSAFLIALLPLPLNRRLILGVGWFVAFMIAMSIGNAADPDFDTPMLFTAGFLYSLPVISLGWLIPFVWLRWFPGWRLGFSESDRQIVPEKITISTLLALTFLIALCFCSLQFSEPRFIVVALVGMLVTFVLGSVVAVLIWMLMRMRLPVVWLIVIGVTCYFSTSYVFFLSGAGPKAFGLGFFVTTILLTSLLGCIILRIGGANLLTGSARNVS